MISTLIKFSSILFIFSLIACASAPKQDNSKEDAQKAFGDLQKEVD